MSTRANIIVKADGEKPLWFYRHYDGYPAGALPTLTKFMDYVKSGAIRDNVGQAAGWLVILGHLEYRPTPKGNATEYQEPQFVPGGFSGWKCGAIEPTNWELHGDTEYLYTLDLTAKTIRCQGIHRDYGTPANYDKEPVVTFEDVEAATETPSAAPS